MYEEFKKKPIDFKILFVKLGIIATVLVLIVLIFNATLKNTAPKSEQSVLLKESLQLLENDAAKYFESIELPKKLNESITINIEELIELEYLENLEYNLKDCNIEKSYSRITFVNQNEYNLTSSLECNEESNIFVTTLIIE